MNKNSKKLCVKQLLVHWKNFVKCEYDKNKTCKMKIEVLNLIIYKIDDSTNAKKNFFDCVIANIVEKKLFYMLSCRFFDNSLKFLIFRYCIFFSFLIFNNDRNFNIVRCRCFHNEYWFELFFNHVVLTKISNTKSIDQ